MTATPSETHEAALSDERLRECPFCGWPVTADEGLCKWDKDEFGDTVDEVSYTGVCCPGCSASVPINAHTPAEAIAAWNRRTQPSAGEPVAWRCERSRGDWVYYTEYGAAHVHELHGGVIAQPL